MIQVLNPKSGVLHASWRCAGRDTRFLIPFEDKSGGVEEVVAVQGYVGPDGRPLSLLHRVDHRCRRCLR